MRESPWSFAELQFLRLNYGKMSYDAMSKNLGRTKDAVRHRCIVIGLTRHCMAQNDKDNAYMAKVRRELAS